MAEVVLKSLTKIFDGTVVAVKEFDLKVEDKELGIKGQGICG